MSVPRKSGGGPKKALLGKLWFKKEVKFCKTGVGGSTGFYKTFFLLLKISTYAYSCREKKYRRIPEPGLGGGTMANDVEIQ